MKHTKILLFQQPQTHSPSSHYADLADFPAGFSNRHESFLQANSPKHCVPIHQVSDSPIKQAWMSSSPSPLPLIMGSPFGCSNSTASKVAQKTWALISRYFLSAQTKIVPSTDVEHMKRENLNC